MNNSFRTIINRTIIKFFFAVTVFGAVWFGIFITPYALATPGYCTSIQGNATHQYPVSDCANCPTINSNGVNQSCESDPNAEQFAGPSQPLDCAPDDHECQIAKQRQEAIDAGVVQKACNGGPECVQEAKDIFNEGAARQTSLVEKLANGDIQQPYFCGFSVTCYLVEFLDWASSGLLRVPLVMVAGFLDQAVTLALNLPMDQIGFVVQGWKIIRDVSNMFYVLILLWVALGTIFDFPKYNVREILPKLVISALLINFSLPLGTLVINTTNALANVFYQGIVDAGTGINGEGKGRLLADKILENTDFVKIVVASVQADLAAQAQNENLAKVIKDEDENLKHIKTGEKDANGNPVIIDCSGGQTSPSAPIIFKDTVSLLASFTQCKDALLAYRTKREAAQGYDLLTFARISAIIWKLILIPTLIFVLFAVALFIFIRTISLAFLLIFGPFVFLAWALPETWQYWTQWWDKLLKWSFFMPVLMFMLFLSITMMTTFTGEKSFATTEATQQVLGATAGKTGLATPGFFTANMHFLFMLMLLIGSLTVADKMGIEMAWQVRGLGQKALGWTKRQAKKPVYAGGRIAKLNVQDILGKGAGAITGSEQFQRIANMPIFSKTGIGGYAARTLEQGRRAGEKAATTRLIEKYGGDVTKMRPEQQAALFATASENEAKTFFTRLEPEDRQKAYEKMNETQKSAFEQKLHQGGISSSDIGMMSKKPTLVAEGVNPALRTLKETDPEQYKDKVIETLRNGGFNFKNASPDFIKSDIGIRLLKTVTEAEVKQVRATKEGAKAFADAISKVDTTPKVITKMEEVITATGREMKEVKVTIPPESLSEYLQKLDTGPFRAMLAGTKLSSDTSEYERIEKALKRMEGKMEKPDRDDKTLPPPSGHIPDAT